MLSFLRMFKKLNRSPDQYVIDDNRQILSPEELSSGMTISVNALLGRAAMDRLVDSSIRARDILFGKPDIQLLDEPEDKKAALIALGANFRINHPSNLKWIPRQIVVVEELKRDKNYLTGTAILGQLPGERREVEHISELKRIDIPVKYWYEELGIIPVSNRDKIHPKEFWLPRAILAL
jgi:hypothetical protein